MESITIRLELPAVSRDASPILNMRCISVWLTRTSCTFASSTVRVALESRPVSKCSVSLEMPVAESAEDSFDAFHHHRQALSHMTDQKL